MKLAGDLIIYAIIAAGLIFWLRSLLGTRHGDERERPNPFAGNGEPAVEKLSDGGLPQLTNTLSMEEKLTRLAGRKNSVTAIENKNAENILVEIARADKNFDIDFFLQAAQDSFVMVVEAFAGSDRTLLKDLLSEKVYNAFDAAMLAREQKGETQSVEIQAVRRAEIIEAGLDGKTASVTLRFKADEVSFIKDQKGEIISGHESRSTEMRDIWTFSRDIRSRDPRWLVTETRGGFEDDNDIIPNA